LILLVDVDVKQVCAQGRDFKWPRPSTCPRCRGRIWGHGFVPAWFIGLVDAVFLRRYRCPDCRIVIRCRPRTHWPRFQFSISAIADCISRRVTAGRWRPDLPRSSQRQWWRRLKRQVAAFLGLSFADSLEAGFSRLMLLDVIPVSRSTRTGNELGRH
jgi:hypothetical protein